jgi:hypothetical protein
MQTKRSETLHDFEVSEVLLRSHAPINKSFRPPLFGLMRKKKILDNLVTMNQLFSMVKKKLLYKHQKEPVKSK